MAEERGSFTRKILEAHVTLQAGQFDGGNTKIITSVPMKVKIEKNGPPDFCKATLEARGLRYEDMDKMSTLAFKPLASAKNLIAVYAGEENENGEPELHLAFSGSITNASADFNSSPDVVFKIEAMAGYYGVITAQSPTAVKGSQPAADFIAMQAEKAGFSFQNDGVTAQLSNAIFNGSPVTQARAAARQVGAELIIDDGVMILSPAGGAGEKAGGGRGNAVLLNKNTGMLGYPVISSDGIQIKALYNPAFCLGGLVEVESIVPKASGTWRIIKLSHDLCAFDPKGGPWESSMTTFYPDEQQKK